MPNIDTMKTSNYLKKEDVGQGVLVTIKGMSEQNIAQDNQPEDLKWLIFFHEYDKPLVSNVTHREQIASYLSSRNSDDWINGKVVLWNDPSVVYQGKTGAIRIRPAQQPTYTQSPVQQNNQIPSFDDDIPDFN